MSYPYDKRYLQIIQENSNECELIESAYYVLLNKYMKEHQDDEPSLPTRMSILGEAMEYASTTLDAIGSDSRVMQDIVLCLLHHKDYDEELEYLQTD